MKHLSILVLALFALSAYAVSDVKNEQADTTLPSVLAMSDAKAAPGSIQISEDEITDNFDDGDAEGWQFERITSGGPPYLHSVENGEMVLENARAVIGNPEWGNYSVEVRFRTAVLYDDWGHPAINIRRTESNNRLGMAFYLVFPAPFLRTCILDLLHPETGEHNYLDTYEHGEFSLRTWDALRLEAEGDKLKVYLNGKPILEASDKTLTKGKVALESWKARVHFDNFRLRLISQKAD